MARDYRIQDQDCVASVAFTHGFQVETLWKHPKNAALKQKRVDPYLLQPGDILHIPDRQIKEEPRATEALHKFKKKGTPTKLRLRLTETVLVQPDAADQAAPAPADDQETVSDDDTGKPKDFETKPRANLKYSLSVDGVLFEGTTDGDGVLEQWIKPNAMQGTLTLEPGTPREEVMKLKLGSLDPLAEIMGMKQRLANLGFYCGDLTGEITDDFSAALAAFQEVRGLPTSGVLDDLTRQTLTDAHGA